MIKYPTYVGFMVEHLHAMQAIIFTKYYTQHMLFENNDLI